MIVTPTGINEEPATVPRNHQPDTGLAAKFSIEFAMASGIVAKRVGGIVAKRVGGIVAKRVGLGELTGDFVQRPDIRALARKLDIIAMAEYGPPLGRPARYVFITSTCPY